MRRQERRRRRKRKKKRKRGHWGVRKMMLTMTTTKELIHL